MKRLLDVLRGDFTTAVADRKWLALTTMLLTVHLLLSPGTVSFGASSEDIRRWERDKDIGRLALALGEKDSDARVAAAGALGKIGDRRAVAPLIEALGDGISAVRDAAAKALDKLGEPLGELMVQSLKGSEKAQEALAAGKDARAVVPLLKLLRAWDPNVCVAAAKTLGKIGDTRAVDPLVKALGDGSGSVREAAAWALEKIGDRRAVVPLTKSLRDGNPDVRATAAWALSKFGDRRAVEPLIKAQEDLYPNVRESATWSIGKLADKKAAGPLIRSLGNEYHKVRIASAWGLGRLGDRRAVDPLIKALGDKDPDVRRTAAWALGKLSDRRAVDPLIRSLGDQIPEVRESLSVSLDELGETLGKRLLESLNGSEEAAEELSGRKDPRCTDILIALLGNQDGKVRRAAAMILGRFRDPRAVDGLVTMAGGWNLRDHAVATVALLKIDRETSLGLGFFVFRVFVLPASIIYLLAIACLVFLWVFVAGRIRGILARTRPDLANHAGVP